MKQEEKFDYAIGLCLEFGALEECDFHEGEYMDSMEYLDHDELTTMILEKNPDALEGFDNREEMAECIQEAMNSAGEECCYCEKNRNS